MRSGLVWSCSVLSTDLVEVVGVEVVGAEVVVVEAIGVEVVGGGVAVVVGVFVGVFFTLVFSRSLLMSSTVACETGVPPEPDGLL